MFDLTTNEIKVTDEAWEYLRSIMGDAEGLRLSILGGKGCGGSEYDLRPVAKDEVDPADAKLDIGEGLILFIPPGDVLKLFGATIDYAEDDVGNQSLKVTNPNETGRCGCGKSVTF
jgi:iron-sulfur cluster assembly protein